jgi:hypothetical protein
MSSQSVDFLCETCRNIDFQSLPPYPQNLHFSGGKLELLQDPMLFAKDCAVREMMFRSIPQRDQHERFKLVAQICDLKWSVDMISPPLQHMPVVYFEG